MLNFDQLSQKITEIANYLTTVELSNYQGLDLAKQLFPQANHQRLQLAELLKNYSKQLAFSAARPKDSLDTTLPIPDAPSQYTVFASDSSQISPSHHEIVYCYLINLGRAMFHYHQNLHPLLDSSPLLYSPGEAENLMKSWAMPIEEAIVHYRTIWEAETLAQMALKWVQPPASHKHIPNLAMLNGSLVSWFPHNVPIKIKRQILRPIMEAWSQLQSNQIPLIGYVSASSSRDVLNFLRLAACVYDYPDCQKHCGHLNLEREQPPCQITTSLSDKLFWANLLAPGLRSGLWKSSLEIMDLYDEAHQIYFCYANVGFEIVRLEFPAWVAQDLPFLERALAITKSQVEKGFGYPIALTEAYHQARLTGEDRAYLFGLLETEMIRTGVTKVATSSKQARKRVSIA